MVKNMKNNKGFTLIELIATIGIIILVGLVIVNNMTGVLSKRNDEEYERFKRELEDGACIYVETELKRDARNTCKSSGCTVTIDDLISKGYIDDDLKDPSNGHKVIEYKNDYKVTVEWENDVKTCKISNQENS